MLFGTVLYTSSSEASQSKMCLLRITICLILIFTKANPVNAQCHFPFIFESKEFTSCTKEGRSDGKLWCSTTPNYDIDEQWMFCTSTDGEESHVTPRCHFPFIFLSKEWMSCTKEGRSDGKLWCSTTPNYDHDRQWIFCNRPASAPAGRFNLYLVLSVSLGLALLCVCIAGFCMKVQWHGINSGLWLSSRRGIGALEKGKDVENISGTETMYENIVFKDI